MVSRHHKERRSYLGSGERRQILWKAGMHVAHDSAQVATGEVTGFDIC